ncbi:MAG TPA: protease inhibitor I42 family protein [Dehalococcoidia bacterium]|jgi:predicted secreted protein|nr:protease inhibitor I42 family protein [Dehalococcoidia bacterium]
MKNFLLLVSISILAGLLTAGCGGKDSGDEIMIAIKPTETVNTQVNQEFILSREFDLNSGYMWREDYDESMLELLERSVDTNENEEGQIVLSQVFRFRALKKGKTLITLVYARQTLEGPLIAQQDIISVNIK